jgi:spore coat polysaccharide biosynthesis predicted glycosyltransferase SpsG/RimJ/RimL family protein N-acetyltransferase
MLLLVRCDAGPRTGVGHAVRCVALAESAAERGHEVRWCGRLTGVEWLLDAADALPPEDEPARLAALAREVGAAVVHVDHYGLPSALRAALGAAGVALSNVEDFDHGRRAADVVVDPNLGSDRAARPDDGSRLLLRGLDYALLRRTVREARKTRIGHPPAGVPPRVLVVMGGTDAAGLLEPVVAGLHAAGVEAEADVIVPAGSTLDLPRSGPVRFRPTPPRPDLPLLMAGADVVVSAAGTTVWELCCAGVPMALVRAADNQADGYAAVVAAGAAVGLGDRAAVSDVAETAGALRALLTDADARRRLAMRAVTMVDGLGAGRVVAALERTVAPTLRARAATVTDAELLHGWRNDEATRRWSRSSEPVPWVDHLLWLEGSLAREDRLLLVIEQAGVAVGTVRWDREDDGSWEVSITVAPEHRGRRLAGPILRAGEEELRSRRGAITVRAAVHRRNAASERLFRAAGYEPEDAERAAGFATYRKRLS